MSNRLFYISLILSLIVHIYCIRFFSLNNRNISKDKMKSFEVVYSKLKQVDHKKPTKELRTIKAIKKEQTYPTKNIKVLSKKREFVPTVGENIKDFSKLTGKFRLDKKRAPNIHSFDKTQKVSISLGSKEQMSNPKYLNYYQVLGGMIKDEAYAILGDMETHRGEVYVAFLVTSDGQLQDIKIKGERTVASLYLKELAVNSVRRASPFPPFPKGLDYPEFTFNIKLYFQPTG